MTKFKPSNYGQEAFVANQGADVPASQTTSAPTSTTEDDPSGWAPYVPLVKEFFFGTDARSQAAVVEAKVKDLEKKVKSTPWPLSEVYATQLRDAKAKLATLKKQAGEARQAADAQQAFRVVMVIGGVALTLGGIAFAVNQIQQARLYGRQAAGRN